MKLKSLISLSSTFILAFHLNAELITQEVSYATDEATMKGYVAYDDSIEGKRPAVLVVHEWWGHNDYARSRTEQLAKLGYTAFAIDMYGEGKQADHPKEAGAFSGEIMSKLPEAKARFEAALNWIKEHETVNPQKTAAIGYCFGGSVVLNMAFAGVDLDAVASFHGGFSILYPTDKDQVKARILIANGAEDSMSKPEDMANLLKTMADYQIGFRFLNYPGATHSFTNPEATQKGQEFGLPLAYNEAADKDSWKQLQYLLKEAFHKD